MVGLSKSNFKNFLPSSFLTFFGLDRTTESLMDKGGKFLKKLWCCVGGRVYQGNLVLSTQLIKPSYSNYIESLTRLSRQEWLQQAEVSKWRNHKVANFINCVVPYSVFRADRLSFKTKMPGSNVNKDQNYQETFWHGWVHLLRCQIIKFLEEMDKNKTKTRKGKRKKKITSAVVVKSLSQQTLLPATGHKIICVWAVPRSMATTPAQTSENGWSVFL